MGYGEYGGGGSIAWKVEVEDATASGKKRAFASGYDPKVTSTFTVTLEYGSGTEADNDLTRLKSASGMQVQGNKIVFTVDVQTTNDNQIRIEW